MTKIEGFSLYKTKKSTHKFAATNRPSDWNFIDLYKIGAVQMLHDHKGRILVRAMLNVTTELDDNSEMTMVTLPPSREFKLLKSIQECAELADLTVVAMDGAKFQCNIASHSPCQAQ